MSTNIRDLTRHIVDAADDLHLPITIRQAGQLATRVAMATNTRTGTVVLSARSLDTLLSLAGGERVTDTAARLDIAVDTVKSRRRALYRRLSVSTAGEAVAAGVRLGLLRLDGEQGGNA